MPVERFSLGTPSQVKPSADDDADKAPASRAKRAGFILIMKKTGKSALRFFKAILHLDLTYIFRGTAKNSNAAADIPLIALPSAAERFRNFKEMRSEIMQEIREENLDVFETELALSGDALAKIVARIDPVYDEASERKFVSLYEDRLCQNAAEDQAAALWEAHSDGMALCEIPFPEYEFQYSPAMYSLCEKIAERLEERSGVRRPMSLPALIGNALDPDVHFPSRTAPFSSR